MGLTRWILALCGYVRLEVCGVHPERVLNACAAAGIACTASEPVDAYTLRITVRARCADTVTELARRSQCEVKTLYRRGLPQLLRRAARYRGACAGLLAVVMVLLTSSLFIWRIDVTGNETLTTGQILRCLDECGVRLGTYWPALSNDLVRNDMILRLPELRWLTVNVHGSRAEVIVREKEPLPDITPDDTPVSIYASATGVILSMDVYAGEARVAPGAAVEPGDVLVSGAVTDLGGGVRPVCARADIRARTRQVLTGQIALTETEKQPAHGARTRWALRVGKKRINFYQNSGIPYENYDTISEQRAWTPIQGKQLPVVWEKETHRAYETREITLDPAQAEEMLRQALMEALEEQMEEGKVLQADYEVTRQGDLLQVKLVAQCTEQIGRMVEMDTQEKAVGPRHPEKGTTGADEKTKEAERAEE